MILITFGSILTSMCMESGFIVGRDGEGRGLVACSGMEMCLGLQDELWVQSRSHDSHMWSESDMVRKAEHAAIATSCLCRNGKHRQSF